MDKLLLNAVRICLMSDDNEKVFSYMEMFNFTQSLKLCIKLCEQLKRPEMAQKVAKFIEDKETREIFA
jgi:DNA-directed RNA polymerase subunit L